MRVPLFGRARPTITGLVVVLGFALVLLMPGPAVANAAADGSSEATIAAGASTPTLAAVFAANAGYSSEDFALVPDVVPASGSQLVVLTFQSSNSSLFSAPPVSSTPLSVSEVADRYGLSPGEYARVESYLASEGLTVVHAWPDRLSLTVEGPVSALDRAFSTTLVGGLYQGRPVTFPATPPSLPSAIEPWVESVVGLSTGFTTFEWPSLSGSGDGLPAQGSGSLITPAIARSIYDVSPLYNLTGSPTYATGEGIALLLWGDGYALSDLQTFFADDYPSGLFPAPSIVPEPVDGAPEPSPSAPDDPCQTAEELTLDLEWSGSMAPGATLYAVYAPGTAYPGCSPTAASMVDALQTAMGLPVAAISMSFGVAESQDGSLRAAFETDLAAASQQGIALFAATGDLGGDAESDCQGGPSPVFPATSPYVLAVGGTDVSLTRDIFGTITGFSESAWNLSGGGYSTQFPAPSWQPPGNAYRGTPDVSASAAEDFLYYQGSDQEASGTSFATPLWAGLVTEMDALYGRSLAPILPRIYAIAEEEPTGKIGNGIADITTGSTCLGSAGPGWDPETGWGSPRGLDLYEELTATFVALSLGVAPGVVGPGGVLTISGHLANATSGAALVGVPAAGSLVSSSTLGPCTGTFGTARPLTDVNGNVSVSVSIPWCYFGSHAVAQLTVLSDGYYGVNATTVAVNLLGFAPPLAWVATYPDNVVVFVSIFVVAAVLGYLIGRPPPLSLARPAPRAPPPGPPAPPPAPPPESPAGPAAQNPPTPVTPPPAEVEASPSPPVAPEETGPEP